MSQDSAPKAGAAAAVAAVSGSEISTPAVPAAEGAADPRQAAFERRERQLNKERQALAAERASWATKAKEYETNYVPKSRLTSDPLSVLQEHGISYDQLTEMLLNSPNPNDPATKAMLAKISALEAKQNDAERKAQEASQAQYDSALKQINTEVKMLVDSNDEYSTIKAAGMQDAVTELIKSTFEAEGYLMDVDEAAKEVETHLVEEGYRLSQMPKVQSRSQQKAAETPEPTPTKQPQATQGLKTLTNTMTQNTPKRSSEKERIARAMAAFHGTNKG